MSLLVSVQFFIGTMREVPGSVTRPVCVECAQVALCVKAMRVSTAHQVMRTSWSSGNNQKRF